jgi:hypothetical protein
VIENCSHVFNRNFYKDRSLGPVYLDGQADGFGVEAPLIISLSCNFPTIF